MQTAARVIGVYIVAGAGIVAIVLSPMLTGTGPCCWMQIVLTGWVILTMIGSAACAGAVLLPFFAAGHVDAFWKQLALFACVGFVFWYVLLFHVFRFEGI